MFNSVYVVYITCKKTGLDSQNNLNLKDTWREFSLENLGHFENLCLALTCTSASRMRTSIISVERDPE